MAQPHVAGYRRFGVDCTPHRIRLKRLVTGLGIIPVLVALLGRSAVVAQTALAAQRAPATAVADDWPTYMHDGQRTGASADTTLSTNTAVQLGKLWSYQTGGMIAAQPTVVNGTVYVGSWDGYEYALDATTGAVRWKTYLGITTASPTCFPAHMGISSSAAVVNGVVYVGGGDAYWYALNATTGAVLWKVYTGDNSATGGHYNWSSPLIYNGYAYLGIASVGDCPLVQGQLLQVSLSTQQVINTLNVVPAGQVGGGIWTSPSVDPATNTIYVTTGTINDPSQTLAQAILAIDATTLTLKDSWQVPQQQTVLDSDWGTSPVLFTDANGRQLVAAINKNGYVYALGRANLGAGPVWQQHIAIGGPCPTCGDGTASNLAFGNGMLYAAGGNTTINGVGYAGSVRALDPATGAIIWQHPDSAPVVPALTYDNGLVLAGVGSSLEVLDASTGNRLYSYTTGAVLYGSPSVANGTIYFGSGDTNIYALGLPTVPPSPPPADPQCPSGWTCQDIGNPQPAGTESVAGSTWTITVGGMGVAGTADQFRLISQVISGDSQVVAQVTVLTGGGGSRGQAGIIVRQDNSPGSPYYAVFTEPNNMVAVQYRSQFAGGTTTLTTANAALPRYLEIQRSGDQFQAAMSSDGATYTLIPGTNATVVMPYAALDGVAVSSGTNGAAGSASVSNVAVGALANSLHPVPSPTVCPSSWTCADVGNPLPVGDQSLSNGTWTLTGAGTDITGYADQFHYIWQSLPGDGTISAHITAQTNTSNAAKSGVMLRQNASAGSAFYGALVTPGQGILVLYRSVQGLRVLNQQTLSGGVPAYIEIARSGSSYSTYSSTDGVNWTYVPGTSIIMSMSSTVLGGLAITSASGGTSSSATMDTVMLSNSAPPPPAVCPTNWSCADIGNPAQAGSESLSNGMWSIEGSGADIWSTFDIFHFDWQALTGDGTLSAHVASQQNTSEWAKAGLMLRLSTDPNAPFYAAYVTPSNGVAVQYRATAGAFAQQAADVAGGAPIYLRVGRSGTTYTAYTSSDGVNWSAIAGSTVSLPSLTGALLSGMAVTSHAGTTRSLATFDSVAFSSCPATWSCADIGAPALLGGQAVSSGTWTAKGAGGDIWGSADQFHYAWQTLMADGSISARVVSQTNTNVWAKAGVMLRTSTDAAAPFYDIVVTPANGISVQYRATAGASAQQPANVAGLTVPVYLRVGRSGTTFSAYTSADGAAWTLVPNSTVTIPALSGTLLAGLTVTSHNVSALSTATFDSVAMSTCPSGWTCADVGGPAPSGSESATGAAWTVSGSGGDIWNTSDQFHFDAQPLAGDGTLSAQATSQTNTSSWAKAGVMVRLSSDSSAPFYDVVATPSNGISVQYRATAGASAQQPANVPSLTIPIYLRIARSGTTFSAYTSADGVTWTLVPNSAISIPALSGTLLAGMAVTAHNNGMLSTATFAAVSMSPCPSGWSCADIGAPALAGTQSVSNGAWTVSGSGGDIWNTTDQFHYVWQSLSANGTLSAHVTSQTNTNGWAKAGLMLRLSADPSAPFYAVYATPANGVSVQYRATAGGSAQQAADLSGSTAPIYLQITRSGTTFTAYTSADGVTWTIVPNSTVSIPILTGALLSGLAVTAHNNSALSTATFDTVSAPAAAATPSGPASAQSGGKRPGTPVPAPTTLAPASALDASTARIGRILV